MAKARPTSTSHSGHSTKSGMTDTVRHNGHAGNLHHDDDNDDAVAPAVNLQRASSVATSSSAPQQSKQQQSGDASEDAYRFLLHHIDSEIAALKRRITTVAKQRESVESNQTRRIRELFECMERPWLLLESTPAPQLPNKALEVYAKELYVKQHGHDAGNVDEDAVFLDACRRNWRGLSIMQRKPYEIAARRNEHMRKELKKKLANGCPYFEEFCEQAKEWTAEMVRDEMRTKSSPGGRQTSQRANTSPARKAGESSRKAAPSAAVTVRTSEAEEETVVSSPKRSTVEKRRGAQTGRKVTAPKKGADAAAATNSSTRAVSPARQKQKQKKHPQLQVRQQQKPNSKQPKLRVNRGHRAKAKAQAPKKAAATKKKKSGK